MDVLCVGHAAWDISLFLDGFPAENSKCEIRTMIECGGGPAANAAYLLTLWGVQCALAAAIGADLYGERIVQEFLAAGTDLSLLQRGPDGSTPVSVILVNQANGSRTIVNRKRTESGDSLRLPPVGWKELPGVLLFDGHELEASLQALALFPKAQSILDAGSLREGTARLAKEVDYLVSSERFACQLSGLPDLATPENQARALAVLSEYNGKQVVITRGENSILYGANGQVEPFPTFPVRAIDTTAAGDIFHGAMAYGIWQHWPLVETLRLASAAAALSVTVRGGRTSIPSLHDSRKMMSHAG